MKPRPITFWRRLPLAAMVALQAAAMLLVALASQIAFGSEDHRVSGVTYEGVTGSELGMPLGGLGTSTFEIGRDGAIAGLRLQNLWSGPLPPTPPATFLSIHARNASGRTAGRLLQLQSPAGLPAVAGLTYTGRFPFVDISYRDPALPCQVALEAFSPFVPQDASASSLPVVFFTFRLRNPGSERVTAAVAVSWTNDISAEPHRSGWPATGNRNTLIAADEPAVLMSTQMEELTRSEYLLACLPAEGVRYRAVSDWWTADSSRRPNAKDDLALGVWECFLKRGTLPAESRYDNDLGTWSSHRPVGAVAGEVELLPGEEKEVRFGLVWYFPYHWDRSSSVARIFLGHQYATRFPKGRW